MDVARLAGEPGSVGDRGPLDPRAPLGEGHLYWSGVCDQVKGERPRPGVSSLPPQDSPHTGGHLTTPLFLFNAGAAL